MTRRLLGGLVATTLAFVLIARADDPTKEAGVDPKAAADAASNKQDQLRRQFSEFEGALLRLKQRLAASSLPQDQHKAANLQKALSKANNERIDHRFMNLLQLAAD